MKTQKLFETIERITGHQCLESEMLEIAECVRTETKNLEFQPIKTLADLPEEITVWLYNIETNYLALGELVYPGAPDDPDAGWLFAVSDGTIYAEDGRIIAECELDDEYEFTHFALLPELPRKEDK